MISKYDIKKVLAAAGAAPGNSYISDLNYRCPAPAWLSRFISDTKRKLSDLGYSYVDGARDCDDFALFTQSLARLAHSRTPGAAGTGIAIGTFVYVDFKSETWGRHALNVAITKDNSGYTPLFFDMQSAEFVAMPKENIQSCEFYLF